MANQKNNTIFTNIAYDVYDDKKFSAKIENMPEGWELLARSNTDASTSHFSYKACAFINHNTQELLIAHAGTDLKHGKDIIDDFWLWQGSHIPYKMSSIKSFIEKIEEKVGKEDIKNYKIETTGHSLGAILSDLCAVELKSKKLEVTKSTTFENPGSKKVIEKAIEKDIFSNQISFDQVKEIGFDIKNMKPNPINSLNPQLGTVSLVVTEENLKSVIQDQNELGQHNYFSYLTNKVGNVAKSAANFLGISNRVQFISDHKLDNFIKHYNEENKELKIENWNNKTIGKTVLAHDENLYKQLQKEKTSDNKSNEYIMYSENNDEEEGISIIDSRKFSHQDLREIHHGNDRKDEHETYFENNEEEEEMLIIENYATAQQEANNTQVLNNEGDLSIIDDYTNTVECSGNIVESEDGWDLV